MAKNKSQKQQQKQQQQKQQQQKQQQQQQQQQQGGDGAADNALKVFGGPNEQHAQSESNNAIAMKNSCSFQAGQQSGGKNVMEDMLSSIPSKHSKQQLKNMINAQLKQLKRQNGGASTLLYSEFNQSAPAHAVSEGMTRVAVGHRGGGDAPAQVPAVDLQKLFIKGGSKLSKQQLQQFSQQLNKLQQQQQQQQQGGVGLNEIVVPLILLYASQRYAQGKTAKKNAKSFSKTFRKSRRFNK
uniref:Uncharacterized protein n=1 Tax=viral metagenome TaxID=1070528 RepID=A0A6C0HH45_9ZZZZ